MKPQFPCNCPEIKEGEMNGETHRMCGGTVTDLTRIMRGKKR